MEKFESDEENHIYKLNGSIIPSVSEIIEPIHKRIYEDISFNTLKSAADIGIRVHRAIEFINKYDFYSIDNDCKGYIEAYKKFRNEHPDWRLLNSEFRTYHKNLLYGMTIDEIYPTKKPDCDNITKVICDALNGVAYYDDSQICKVYFEKKYAQFSCVKIEINVIKEV